MALTIFCVWRLTLTGHPATEVALGSVSGPVTSDQVSSLRDLHRQVWPLVHGSRYNELAPLVSDLVPRLERAVRAEASAEQIYAVRELLADTYQQ